MRQFDTATDSPKNIHAALTARDDAQDAQVESVARAIVDDVRARGDAAVLDYTRRFDWPDANPAALGPINPYRAYESAWKNLPDDLRDSIGRAENNISTFHRAERGHLQSWMEFSEEQWHGVIQGPRALGQRLQPVERVGVYVPGGKAFYPSTVLMALLPACSAGVENFVVCTPLDRNGEIAESVQAVLWEVSGIFLGQCQVFTIGGAQAIAAMAYGTETIPRCDVVVGPGNAYVNAAKRLVYGQVGIDMLAGPSEIAVIADDGANPAFAAADLLAQTEHGPDNRGVFFCHSMQILKHCKIELEQQRAKLSRQDVLTHTAGNIVFIKTQSLAESVALSNILAPEHLELMVREPLALLPSVRNAGAVLLGDYTSAPLGDYWAGPSHTLPTAGAARFSSPLSVATFLKRTSVVYYSREAAQNAAAPCARFADAEGFDAHAAAVRLRAQDFPPSSSAPSSPVLGGGAGGGGNEAAGGSS